MGNLAEGYSLLDYFDESSTYSEIELGMVLFSHIPLCLSLESVNGSHCCGGLRKRGFSGS